MPGRRTFTTTRAPESSVAACTCAIEAAASQQVSPSREYLSELDERNATVLKREPQRTSERGAAVMGVKLGAVSPRR